MKEKLTNRLIASVGKSIPQLFERAITLLLDNRGNILDLASPNTGHFASVARQLKNEGHVLGIFPLPRGLTFSQAADAGREIVGNSEKLEIEAGLEFFYFAYPFGRLKLARLSSGRCLGVVIISDVLPNVFEKSSGAILFLDRTERIVGMSDTFMELFAPRVKRSAQILRHPAGKFLDPPPSEIQRRFLAQLPSPEALAFDAPREIRFDGRGLMKDEEASDPSEFRAENGGLRWTARHPDGSFLTLTHPLPFAEGDLRIRVETAPDGPDFPCLILGDHKKGHAFRDSQGYLLGGGYADNRMILKKMGFTMTGEPFDLSGTGSLDFFKMGGAFFVYRKGVRIFAFYDPDLLSRESVFPILYLRAGQSCLLKRVTLSVRAAPRPPAPAPVLVRLKNGRENGYLLNRFDSFALTASNGDLAGFRLQDVTALQGRFKAMEREGERLQRLVKQLKGEPGDPVGSGKTMSALRDNAARAANSASTVLIEGPTGTGKEVLARFIHTKSPFAKGPFVKVDCSTLPRTLMESELFGHEAGAFTGALGRKMGLLERAHQGTLFLDEVNNLIPEVQAKLLQFLQDFTVVRLGGHEPLKLNLRVIAASGASLKNLSAKGLFREDLYFRIAVVTFALPPLRERLEDLPDLVEYFLEHLLRGKPVVRVTPAAYQKLYRHAWPGNIRELKNVVERAILFCDGEEITPDLLHLSDDEASPTPARKAYRAIHCTPEALRESFARHRGMATKVAEELGVTRRAIYYHLRKLKLAPNEFRENPRA